MVDSGEKQPNRCLRVCHRMGQVIPAEWLDRSVLFVAPELIGCTLVRQLADGRQLRGRIVETEAYQAGDPACHAYRKQTERNRIMFGAAGYVYVYLIYGMYHCVNIVTDRDEFPSAVLIRALELDLETLALTPIKPKEKSERVAAGPGKLCQAMQIDLDLYGTKLEQGQAIWLESRDLDWQTGLDTGEIELIQTTRIGLTQGVDLPWRWYVKGCKAVSKW
jgi:DNA-3-methyladenine glycosylase